MNHLFTFKARIALFALLLSYIGSKAQTTPDTVKSSSPAMNIDTSVAKNASNSQLIKTDTTLVIRAGATIMKKADTTMVIDPDGSLAKKFNEMVAAKEKADQEKSQSNAAPVKADSSSVQKTDAPIVAKQDNTAVKTDNGPAANAVAVVPVPSPETATQMRGTTPPPNTYQQVRSATNPLETHPAGTDEQQAAVQQQPSDNGQSSTQQQASTDNGQAAPQQQAATATQQKASTDNAQSATQQQVNAPVDSSKKVDSAMVAKVDTTIKKDTTIKQSDSTMMAKSDTSMMITDTSAVQHVKAVNAYLEVGGPGLAISGNYDARFKKERNGWGYRIGAGYFASGGNTVFTVPFQINYLYGEHAALVELGAGTTFLNSTGTNVGNSKWEFDKVTGFIATATIGFRYQPQSRGLNFRIAFVPILYDEGLIAAGGVSIGYTFK